MNGRQAGRQGIVRGTPGISALASFKGDPVKIFLKLVCIVPIAFCSVAWAQSSGKPPGACQKIADACKSAGIIKGDWKKGDGLWRDCVDPIMQGQTSAPGATKPLPTVDPGTISACKAKHPKYGSGKVGSQGQK